ncbi:MAG: bifunctional YncE family protein/alkaline phosphatase family protein [Bacillota bacterium]|nr:bifunctional YncE family protein/alkaline phosphatase family protein [Bacillota bacterium]
MTMRRKVAAALLATTLVGSGTALAYSLNTAGPRPDGTGVTPHGWTLTPAGKQITLGDFPMGGSISPDHRYLVVSNDGQGTQSLQVVDLQNQKVVQTIPYTNGEGLYYGTAFSPDGKTFYASAGGNNKIRVFGFNNGMLAEQSPILMNNPNVKTPMGISISPDGKILYTANNETNSVSKIDLASGQIIATTTVGADPYTAQITKDGSAIYVSNWGEDTVTVLDPNDLTVVKRIPVGLHPNAIAENPATGLIYVADSDRDTISVIDPKDRTVVQTIDVRSNKEAALGSQPVALTFSPDGKTLYVANAGTDAIAVIDIGNGTKEAQVSGLIPTAWYPSAVYTNGNQLMVLNAKGLGAGPNTQNQYIGSMMQGTMSFINLPDQKQLKDYTKQVEQNNPMNDIKGNSWFGKQNDGTDFPIPRAFGQKSPIKHVIYVIKENRTYDQVLGDLGKGNGDPSLTEFGKNLTPNIHKLVNQFVTLDNFYTDAEVSDPGHQWVIAGKSNDYSEKTWLPDYSGRKGYGVDKPALKPADGYLWDNAKKYGVSFRDYGEYINYWESPTDGKWVPDDPGIGDNYDPNYAGWDLSISDMTRYNEWEKEFKQFEKNGSLPQLEMVYLPNDHTAGTASGYDTPQAMVAQNDLALGKLVETVSHSQYWKDTAIFVMEDDAQAGPDHVDAHRTEALVISPYTQKGTVDSTLYDQDSMIRTMELILGMKPMSLFDASAVPMLNSFTANPNFKPYNVEQENYPVDWKNGQPAPANLTSAEQNVQPAANANEQQSTTAEPSTQLDFSKPDTANQEELNRQIWKATRGHTPYPEKASKGLNKN